MVTGPATFAVMLIVGLLLLVGAVFLRSGRGPAERTAPDPLANTERLCVRCGRTSPAHARYCAHCGGEFEDASH